MWVEGTAEVSWRLAKRNGPAEHRISFYKSPPDAFLPLDKIIPREVKFAVTSRASPFEWDLQQCPAVPRNAFSVIARIASLNTCSHARLLLHISTPLFCNLALKTHLELRCNITPLQCENHTLNRLEILLIQKSNCAQHI